MSKQNEKSDEQSIQPVDSTNNQLAGYKAPAVHKAFQIIRAVAQSPKSLGLVELSRQLGYSKSTTHGLVHALLREGVLTQGAGGRKFFLGPAIAELLYSSWDQDKVRALAEPILNEMRDTINETVILGARIRQRILIIATAETHQSLKISVPVGSTIPLIAGAVGKAFLAKESTEDVVSLLGEHGLRSYTAASITDIYQYLEELAQVRKQGYAVDIEEYLPGIRAVAVALDNLRGLPVTLWVVGISTNMDDDKIGQIALIAKEKALELQLLLDDAFRSRY